MPRLFIGIELPETLRHTALEACSGYPAPRWQSPSQLHLTLRFLGDVSPGLLPQLHGALERVEVRRFNMGVAGVGCFGREEAPRILWAGMSPTEPLHTLRAAIDDCLLPLGLVADGDAFRPHVTLARLRAGGPGATDWLIHHAGLASPVEEVSLFSLISSVPAEGGSRYTAIGRYALI